MILVTCRFLKGTKGTLDKNILSMSCFWRGFSCGLTQVSYSYVNTPVFLEKNSSFTWKVSTVFYCNFDFWFFWGRGIIIWSPDYGLVLFKRLAGLRRAVYVTITCITVYSRWFNEEIYASSVGGKLDIITMPFFSLF